MDDTTDSLRARGMRELIGCARFECVSLPENIDVWIDEEGMYRSEVNDELTALVRRHQPTTPIYGRGLVLGVNPDSGETVSLTLDQMASVVAWWRSVTAGGNDPAALRPRLALA
ncbi:DUF3846 domain-containing protein [Leifsonia aquatica]|uniref:DUF3846 domain-containing protein n=1 Tax=Leifsonia aquatica TaxID=144185 RepID=UPI003807C6CA